MQGKTWNRERIKHLATYRNNQLVNLKGHSRHNRDGATSEHHHHATFHLISIKLRVRTARRPAEGRCQWKSVVTFEERARSVIGHAADFAQLWFDCRAHSDGDIGRTRISEGEMMMSLDQTS